MSDEKAELLAADTDDDDDEPPAAQASHEAATQEDADAGTDDDAATAAPRVWGRLMAEGDSTVSLVLEGDGPFTIGRKVDSSLRIDNPRMSGLHARITLSDAGVPQIEDCSTNGVWQNGTKLGKTGQLHALQHLDEIALSIPPAGADSKAAAARFVFAVPAAARTTADAAPAVPPAAGASSSSAADGDDAVEENLQCGICQDILYKPVSLQPCLHAFCGACFCEWAKRNDKCPQCRNSVRVVARNHAIGNIVDAYLAKHPDKVRDAEELARLDTEDTIGAAPRAMRKRDREEGMEMFAYAAHDDDDGEEDDGGDDSDDDGGGHPFGAHGGMAAMMHAAVMQMRQQMPLASCPGCARQVPASQLTSLSARRPHTLPFRALSNPFERGVLLDYLQTKGLAVADLVNDELLRRVGTNEFHLIASQAGPPLDPQAGVCASCFDRAFVDLLYQYRRAIPREELPASVTARGDCWYGHGCRTQTHNALHAQRLNHICEPTRGAGSGRGGGGRGGGRHGGAAAAAAAAAGGGADGGDPPAAPPNNPPLAPPNNPPTDD